MALSVTTSSLPSGVIGVAYSQTLAASGGTTPYSWAIISGAIPNGLNISTAGVISGTPAAPAGTFTFTVQVTDSATPTPATATASLSITIYTPVVITTPSPLPGAPTSVAYSETLSASGGSGTGYTWTLSSGTLPSPLTLSSAGLISGTPTTPGTSTFTVQVTDSASNSTTATFSLSVETALSITTTTLPNATAAAAYTQTLAATGGTGTGKVWSVASGSLPTGMTLSSGGVLSGTTFIPGLYSFTVALADSGDFTATQALTLTVGTAQYPANFCPNPNFQVNTAGWSGLTGTTISQSAANALVGQTSMLVVTDGSVVGEGVLGPVGPAITAATTGVVSLSIYSLLGGGTLNVEAVTSTGTVLASTLVTLVAGYQRVILQGFAVPVGAGFGVMVATNSPEAMRFWVGAVMYQLGATTAAPYGDGNTTGWQWLGTPGASYSQELYPNATSATGKMRLEGKASPVAWQKPSYTSASGSMVLAGDLAPTSQLPPGSFADFAIFELTDPDPAMTYVDQNNAGAALTSTGTFFYDFESSSDVSNFSAPGTLAQSTGWANTGTHSMLWTTTNAANSSCILNSFTVTPGDFVNASWMVYCAQVQQIRLLVDWYNGATYLSTSGASAQTTVAPNTPTQMTLQSAQTPANANAAHVYLDVLAPATGNLIYIDTTYTTYAHYLQSFGLFYPPLDYPVSNGKYLWRRAAFAGVGFYYSGVPAASEVIATDIEVALCPLPLSGAPVPATFTPPRQLVTIIKPTRLNYCPNPSFESSLAGWSPTGAASLSQDVQVPTPSYDTVLLAGSLGPFFNNVAITNDYSSGFGNFGDGANTYSQQQLIVSNLGPGSIVQSGGIGYVMPDVAANTLDNVQCYGQTIPIGGPLGAQVMGFLGASVDGGMTGVTGTVTINYTDGSTGTASLTLSDWTLDAGAASLASSNQIAGNIPYRNNDVYGTRQTVTTYIFSQTIAVNPAKAVASITLPNAWNMHIFAISMAEISGNGPGSYSCKATVTASGDGLQVSIPDLIVGDTYTLSFSTQAAAGISAINTLVTSGTIIAGGGFTNQNQTAGVPYGGTLGVGYGQGFFGGVSGSSSVSPVTPFVWTRPWVTFVANASSVVIDITATTGTGFVAPSYFWTDLVLIEAGELVGTYFDGSYGSPGYLDYQWDAGTNGGTLDQAATSIFGETPSSGGSTGTLAWAVNPRAGSKVIVAVSCSASSGISLADNGGNTWVTDNYGFNGSDHIYFYRADNIVLPSSGFLTVTITMPNSTWYGIGGASFLGLQAGGPISPHTYNTGSGNAVSANPVTLTAPAVIIGGFNDGSGANPEGITAGGGYTTINNWTNGVSGSTGGWSYAQGAAGQTMTATWALGDSVSWAACQVAYQATILARSYYYEQLAVKKFSINEILSQHTPLGLTAAAPQYLIPYTQ